MKYYTAEEVKDLKFPLPILLEITLNDIKKYYSAYVSRLSEEFIQLETFKNVKGKIDTNSSTNIQLAKLIEENYVFYDTSSGNFTNEYTVKFIKKLETFTKDFLLEKVETLLAEQQNLVGEYGSGFASTGKLKKAQENVKELEATINQLKKIKV